MKTLTNPSPVGSSNSGALPPVRGQNGDLQLAQDGIVKVWSAHYSALAADTVCSRDSAYWKSRRGDIDLTSVPTLAGIIEPLFWPEVGDALKRLMCG